MGFSQKLKRIWRDTNKLSGRTAAPSAAPAARVKFIVVGFLFVIVFVFCFLFTLLLCFFLVTLTNLIIMNKD